MSSWWSPSSSSSSSSSLLPCRRRRRHRPRRRPCRCRVQRSNMAWMLAPCQCPHGCSHHAGGLWLKGSSWLKDQAMAWTLAPCQCPHGCSHHAGGQWLKGSSWLKDQAMAWMLAPYQCPHGYSHHAGGQWLKDQAGSRIKLAQGKLFVLLQSFSRALYFSYVLVVGLAVQNRTRTSTKWRAYRWWS